LGHLRTHPNSRTEPSGPASTTGAMTGRATTRPCLRSSRAPAVHLRFKCPNGPRVEMLERLSRPPLPDLLRVRLRCIHTIGWVASSTRLTLLQLFEGEHTNEALDNHCCGFWGLCCGAPHRSALSTRALLSTAILPGPRDDILTDRCLTGGSYECIVL
jgi:hypothetical protein